MKVARMPASATGIHWTPSPERVRTVIAEHRAAHLVARGHKYATGRNLYEVIGFSAQCLVARVRIIEVGATERIEIGRHRRIVAHTVGEFSPATRRVPHARPAPVGNTRAAGTTDGVRAVVVWVCVCV